MSYDIGDDAGDADVGHPGYCVLWGENRVESHLAKRRQPGTGASGLSVPGGPVALPGLGRRAPGTSFYKQRHLDAPGIPAGSGKCAAGARIGAARDPQAADSRMRTRAQGPPRRPLPHLQSQGGSQHAAGGEADGEA